MKFSTTLIVFTVFTFLSFISSGQTISHPTINKLDVSYKEPEIQVDSIHKVRIQSSINLKSDVDVSKIHFKILHTTDSSLIYQVDYTINSMPVTNPEGVILFKKEGQECYITSSSELVLNTYLFEITTEDSQGNLTEVYSEIK